MVRGNVALLILIKNHQWELNHPKEFVIVRVNRELLTFDEQLSGIQAHTPENRASSLPLARGEEDDVAVLNLKRFGQRRFFLVREKFHDGRLPLTIFTLDEGKALGSEGLRGVFQIT